VVVPASLSTDFNSARISSRSILAKLDRLPVPLRGSLLTLRWREMDSNHQYLEDKRRFVQRLRLCRVFDESLATATFFTPLGIIARNLSGR